MQIPEGVSVSVDGLTVLVKGPKGEVAKRFKALNTSIKVEGNEVKVDSQDLAIKNTIQSIINNMFVGVTEGYVKKMKILYAHFPFTFEIKGDKVYIKNFLGEKVPRKAKIVGNVKVEVKGKELWISGTDKEAVGQTAANIKQALKIRGKDSRIFQDGVYEIKE